MAFFNEIAELFLRYIEKGRPMNKIQKTWTGLLTGSGSLYFDVYRTLRLYTLRKLCAFSLHF